MTRGTMQTFLPSSNYWRIARVLDNRRLGKQLVEGMQVVSWLIGQQRIVGNPYPYYMWHGHLDELLRYLSVLYFEWKRRWLSGERGGKKLHKSGEQAIDLYRQRLANRTARFDDMPGWMGDQVLHRSHRSNLLRKKPVHYQPYFETNLANNLPYHWPVLVAPAGVCQHNGRTEAWLSNSRHAN